MRAPRARAGVGPIVTSLAVLLAFLGPLPASRLPARADEPKIQAAGGDEIQRLRDELRAERERSEQLGYQAEMNRVRDAWEHGQSTRIPGFLDRVRPPSRGWEWHYWNRLVRTDRRPVRLASLYTPFSLGTRQVQSRDGRWIASPGNSSSRNIVIWDTGTGRVHQRLPVAAGPTLSLNGLAFSPDGHRLGVVFGAPRSSAQSGAGAGAGAGAATANAPSTPARLKIYDVESGRETADTPFLDGFNPSSLALGPEGRQAFASEPRLDALPSRAAFLDVESGKAEPYSFEGSRYLILPAAFSPDGKELAVSLYTPDPQNPSSLEARACLIDVATRKTRLTTHQAGTLTLLTFSADGKLLAGSTREPASGRTGVVVWETGEGRKRIEIPTRGWTRRLAFSPDGTRLACADSSADVRVFDTASGALLHEIKSGDQTGAGLSWADNGTCLRTVSAEGAVRDWQVPANPPKPASPPPTIVAVSPDGDLLAGYSPTSFLFGTDKSTKPFELLLMKTDGEEVRRLELDLDPRVSPLARFSRDGRRLAIALNPSFRSGARSSPLVTVIDTASGEELRRTEFKDEPGSSCRDLAFSPDGERLAAALSLGSRQLLRLLEVKGESGNGGKEAEVSFPNLVPLSVAYSPDGSRLAVTLRGGTSSLALFETRSLEKLRDVTVPGRLFGQSSGEMPIVFSPDGSLLAFGYWPPTAGNRTASAKIGLIETATGGDRLTLDHASDTLDGLAFSPDGRRLATAASGGFFNRETIIRLWDTAAGLEVATLRADVYAPTLRFSGDGNRLIAARYESPYLQVWDGTPIPPEVEADDRVAALSSELAMKDDITERLKAADLDEPVRRAALAIAAELRDDPERLTTLSLTLTRWGGNSTEDVRYALRYAEAAAALQPDDGRVLSALGSARYRAGSYPEALEALTRSDTINRRESGKAEPIDLAFLAMTCHKLGRTDEARQYLAALRDRLKETSVPAPITGAYGSTYLKEAEALIEPAASPTVKP